MQVWLRLVVVWLVALALPVQGIAGVTMAHCGQSHERMEAAKGTSHHQHSAHEAGAAHHHHDAGMADTTHTVDQVDQADHPDPADHAAAAQAKAEAQPGKFSDLGQYKCSSCASCCAGFALPSTMPRVPEPLSAPAVFAEAVVTVDAFETDGPDRPPRTRLA
jgi:hypothetical protein